MSTKEQLEAWTSDAANSLQEKIGKRATVIVSVLDLSGQNALYFSEYRSTDGSAIVLWLLEIASRSIKDRILPKDTIQRNGDGK
jgi:hypothetical protein